MADVKETYKQITAVKRDIAEKEALRNDTEGVLGSLDDADVDGTDPEINNMKAELSGNLEKYDRELAPLRQQLASLQEMLPKKATPAAPKFDPEKHPLLRKATEAAEPAAPVVFNAGDKCEALWTDRNWYKAKIQTVLGSASDPKYLVLFTDYEDNMTVGRDAIRPLQSVVKKRKVEAPLPVPSVGPSNDSPHVISGPASVNPDAIAAKKDTVPETNDPKKRRTIGSNKALEKKQNAWLDFQNKGKGKKIAKKESMFRTGTTPNSRVGFTGSGAGMTSTTKRVRYNNKAEGDEEAVDNPGKSREWRDEWQSKARTRY